MQRGALRVSRLPFFFVAAVLFLRAERSSELSKGGVTAAAAASGVPVNVMDAESKVRFVPVVASERESSP